MMTTTSTRLITLILMLQRQPGQKAADLARQLDVSVRTVHRYFGMLDEMGVPVYAERGPYGGFSLVPGYKLPPLIFSPEEAVALSLGTGLVCEMWGQVYAEAARSAQVKLENVLPADQRQEITWAQHSLLTTGINRADMTTIKPLLETLREAVHDSRQIEMTYQNSKNETGETRIVDVYGLFHRSGWWYAVGFCHLREGLRTFRVDRIMNLALLKNTFTRPPDFDFQTYIAQDWQDVPQVKVRMMFPAFTAHLALYARQFWSTYEPQQGGSVIVSFNAPDFNSAASNALTYGPGALVLEPDEVRRIVREWAEEVVRMYK